MTAHTLREKPFRRPPARGGVVQLGSAHFWLLIAILGGLLGLFGAVFVAYVTRL